MQLNNFKAAWKQFKIVGAMQHIESGEILAIIEGHENTDRTRLQNVLFNLVMVIVITIVCQGG